jgi:carbonic anhydrase
LKQLKKFLHLFIIKFLLIVFCSYQTFADENLDKTVKNFVNDMLKDNDKHMKSINKNEYSKFAEKQTPRATVVMCSDSRIQTEAFKDDDVNDIFVIRNIGNQIKNSYGSVEYGIHFLKTPVLLIIGHFGCGV